MPDAEPPDAARGSIAVVSDIHGNLDALEAVLHDIAMQECRGLVCLGDVIGYGPEPEECIRLVRKVATVTVMGNHEAMFLEIDGHSPDDRERTNNLWRSLGLCREVLPPGDKEWIRDLPLVAVTDDASFVHASLHRPQEFDYIYAAELAADNFKAQETPVSFHGHTHVPAVWEEHHGEIDLRIPGEDPIQLNPACRYAVCAGSVGQPRDHDPRAAYMLYDPENRRIAIRRVPYDISRAQVRFFRRGLSGYHAVRIALGE